MYEEGDDVEAVVTGYVPFECRTNDEVVTMDARPDADIVVFIIIKIIISINKTSIVMVGPQFMRDTVRSRQPVKPPPACRRSVVVGQPSNPRPNRTYKTTTGP